jgi:hypothetical protein
VPRLDSGYASKSKNLASAACGYLQGFTVLVMANPNKTTILRDNCNGNLITFSNILYLKVSKQVKQQNKKLHCSALFFC